MEVPGIEFSLLVDALTDLESNGTIEHTLVHYMDYVSQFGLSNMLITGLPPAEMPKWQSDIVCNAWPREWYDRYVSQCHYRFDPCVRKSQQTYTPFFWSELQHGDLRPRERLVFDEAAEFKMHDGFCIPIHRPFQPPAVITLSGERVDLRGLDRFTIEALSHHLFRALSAHSNQPPGNAELNLTTRELEVVQWAADGKSNEDVACIMGISKHTVERHLRNIRSKTDSSNTTHAVVKALRTHQIQ